MTRQRSGFSRDVLVGRHVVAVAPEIIYAETAYERATRTFKHAILHSFWHLIWIAICGIVAAAVVAGATANSTDWITAGLVSLIGGLVGLGFGLGTSFAALWTFAPRDQRDELRAELFDVRGRYGDLLEELNRPPRLAADARIEASPNDGGPLLRLGITN
jgi:hypothetical protein